MKIKLFIFALSLMALAGCSYFEEDLTSPDGSAPYISVLSPGENTVFTDGQVLNLKSEILDKDKINQLEVQIIKLNAESSNAPVWGFTQQPKKNPVVIDTALAVSSLPAGDYLLTLNTVDSRTNVGTKEIKFSVK